MKRDALFVAAIAALWAAFAAVVYVPDVGRGFVKDDFRWIDAGRAAVARPGDVFLRERSDFYRPGVELTFAADYAVHALRPRGYGFTNFGLYVGCIAALWMLGRALSVSAAGAAVAALVWAANPHGINMAVVWISGRTSLCLTLASMLATIAMLQRRYVWTSVLVAGALGCKEEAVLLPGVLVAWDRLICRGRALPGAAGRADWRLLVAVAAPLAVYAGLRARSGAMTPSTAPSFYQLTFAPALVARNVLEYLDRAATMAVVAMLIAAAVWRVVPSFDRRQRRVLAACGIWTACGYAVTVFLPVRSSLYAVFPSIGPAIACAVVLDAMLIQHAANDVAARRRALARLAVVFCTALLAAIPVYRARNGRYVEPARLSERALRTIAAQTASTPSGTVIVLHDVDDPASNFVGAFGTFGTTAVSARAGRDLSVWIDPPPGEWRSAGLRPPGDGDRRIDFAVDRGRVFRVNP